MVSLEMLQQFPALKGLEPEFLAQLAVIGDEKTFEKEQWLFYEDDPADALFLILNGCVDLKFKLDEKREAYGTLNQIGKGNIAGWSAIVEPYIYRLGAVTSDRTQLIQLDSPPLRRLLAEYPEQGFILMQAIAQTMSSRVSALTEQVPGMSFRFFVSTALFTLGVISGVFVLLAFILAVFGAVSGYAEGIPVVLLCALVPAGFLWMAKLVDPALKSVVA